MKDYILGNTIISTTEERFKEQFEPMGFEPYESFVLNEKNSNFQKDSKVGKNKKNKKKVDKNNPEENNENNPEESEEE